MPIKIAGMSPAAVRTEYRPPTCFGSGTIISSSLIAVLYRSPSGFSVMMRKCFFQLGPNHFLAPPWIRSKSAFVSNVPPDFETKMNSVFFLSRISSYDLTIRGSSVSMKRNFGSLNRLCFGSFKSRNSICEPRIEPPIPTTTMCEYLPTSGFAISRIGDRSCFGSSMNSANFLDSSFVCAFAIFFSCFFAIWAKLMFFEWSLSILEEIFDDLFWVFDLFWKRCESAADLFFVVAEFFECVYYVVVHVFVYWGV